TDTTPGTGAQNTRPTPHAARHRPSSSETVSSVVVRVVVRVVVGARTGPRGGPSTTGLAEVAATVLPGAQLGRVVGDHHAHLGQERRVVLAEVAEEPADPLLVTHDTSASTRARWAL